MSGNELWNAEAGDGRHGRRRAGRGPLAALLEPCGEAGTLVVGRWPRASIVTLKGHVW